MTFGKPRHDNKRIIYKQTSANRCGGYFFYNSLKILIVHVFALDHLHGKDLKNCGQFIMKKKVFLQTLGGRLIVNMKEAYQH